MDVLARDLDLGELAVPGRRKLRDDGLDELLGRRSTGGQPDRAVTVEQTVIQLALPVDQRRGGAVCVAPCATISLTASWRFCVA